MAEELEFEGKLKKVYLEVVEKFPWVKKDEITLKYSQLVFIIGFFDVDPYIFLEADRLVKSPHLLASDDYFRFDDEQKKAMVAHELGHYKRSKGCSIERLSRDARFKEQLILFHSPDDVYKELMLGSDKKLCRKMDRLTKWYLLNEIYADNEAVKAGYKEPLLSALERTLKEYSGRIRDNGKDMIVKRIKKVIG